MIRFEGVVCKGSTLWNNIIKHLQSDRLHFSDRTEVLEMKIQCTHFLSMSLICCFYSINKLVLHSFLPPDAAHVHLRCNSVSLSDWLSPQPKSHAWKCTNKVILSENISDVISEPIICIISIHLKLFTYDSGKTSHRHKSRYVSKRLRNIFLWLS